MAMRAIRDNIHLLFIYAKSYLIWQGGGLMPAASDADAAEVA